MRSKVKFGFKVDTSKEIKNVLCKCGCGQLRPRFDNRARERNYIKGHQNMKGENNLNYKKQKHSEEKILCACGCGELRLKYTRGRERFYIWGHKNRIKKGHNISPETQFKKGHKLNEESEIKRRINISIMRKGMKFDEKHCINISKGKKGIPNQKVSIIMKGVTGPNSHHWEGGITPVNTLLREGSIYKSWRELVFLRDNFICQNQNCLYCKNKIGGYLHSHHIKKFSDFPELRFDINNGITLCKGFHSFIRNKEEQYEDYFNRILMKQGKTSEVLINGKKTDITGI